MHTAICIPDPGACRAAARNEAHVADDAPMCTLVAALAVVAVLMLGGYAVAGVKCAAIVASMLGVIVAADWAHDAADEVRKAGALR